jgi:hypothetical protein
MGKVVWPNFGALPIRPNLNGGLRCDAVLVGAVPNALVGTSQ